MQIPRFKAPVLHVRLKPLALAVATSLTPAVALALPSIEFENGLKVDSQVTVNYTYSFRTRSPDSHYLADINNDDATRNFERYAPINNRVSVFGELRVQKDNIGGVLRASDFYDEVYKSDNDNDSAATVNRVVNTPGDESRFTSSTRRNSGSRFQLLDAYLYGNFPVGESQYLSLNAGRHLVAWGESLFWPNISQGQAPVDSTKFNVPGTEAKDAYLPVNQLSFTWSLNESLALTGFYQLEWEETLLNPVGDFFGGDFFGPGSQFYRFAPGVISNLPDASFTVANSTRVQDPRDSGQWGLGARWNLDFNTELGLYHYRYHDRVASMFFDTSGTTQFSSLSSIDDAGYGAGVPTLKFGYFEDLKLTGLSLTSKVGDVQIGSDLSLREGAPVYLSNGAPTTGDVLMANANLVYILGPNGLANQTTLMGELVNTSIQSVDTLTVTGGLPGENGKFDDFVYDGQTRSDTLLGVGAYLDFPSVFNGWDLTTSGVWQQNVDGSGSQGLGRDEKRLTLGATFSYIGNLELGATWVNYLSSADLDKGRTLADRDYVSLNAKYTF
ncbi:DUF1302 domain-containing protein [Pseudomonas marincola]|uniref:DUF1302 domain-containing protein n=1 Tax=Pseudomonas marincola TaxID=437900 RepID=UPI0008EDCB26|nr:DUF1302 family protein [Pseudomonas marincola]SFU14228.1 Protein of unknown function [Pseudomonas marincola]